ncbi:MAG: LD-carboxypeptidase [Rickettsiales bacterium]
MYLLRIIYYIIISLNFYIFINADIYYEKINNKETIIVENVDNNEYSNKEIDKNILNNSININKEQHDHDINDNNVRNKNIIKADIDNNNDQLNTYFNKPQNLKIGLILHSSFVYPFDVNKTIQFIISRNIFDGYKDIESEYTGCYAFISEFTKNNFVLFTKNSTNFLNSLNSNTTSNNKNIKNSKITLQDQVKNENIKDQNTKNNTNATNNILKHITKYYIKDLKEALYQNEVKYLMSIRGGYNASDLIDDLFKLEKPQQEKLFIGFSDATILHLFFSQQWNWKTIHGPVLLSADHVSQQNFRKLINLLLSKKEASIKINLKPINHLAKITKNLESLVTGGNLCVVQTSIGTKIQIDTQNKILILEETKESIYKVKRMLKHLKDAGLLNNATAIIIGTIDCNEEIKMPIVLQTFFDNLAVPVFYTNKIGHNKYNFPFIINEKAKIINNNNQFIFYQTFKNIYK